MGFPYQLNITVHPYRRTNNGKGKISCKTIPKKAATKNTSPPPNHYLANPFLITYTVKNKIVQCITSRRENAIVKEKLREANQEIKKGHTKKAIKTCIKLITEHPDSKLIYKAYMTLGDIHFRGSNYKHSIYYYRALLNKFSKSKYAPMAKLMLGQCLWKCGYYQKAVKIWDELQKSHPKSLFTTEARVFLMFAYSGLNLIPEYKNFQLIEISPIPKNSGISPDLKRAKQLSQQVLSKLPNSQYAVLVRFCLASICFRKGLTKKALLNLKQMWKQLKSLQGKLPNNRANYYLEYKLLVYAIKLFYSIDKHKFSNKILNMARKALKTYSKKLYLDITKEGYIYIEKPDASIYLAILEFSWDQKEVANSYDQLSLKTEKKRFKTISKRNGLTIKRLWGLKNVLFFTDKSGKYNSSNALLMKFDPRMGKFVKYQQGKYPGSQVLTFRYPNGVRFILKDPIESAPTIENFLRAMQLVPQKMFRVLRHIEFNGIGNTEYKYLKGKRHLYIGRRNSTINSVIHEFSHVDDLTLTRGINGKDIWKFRGKNHAPGDDSQLFYEIDWPDEKLKYELYVNKSQKPIQAKWFNPESFTSSYAMSDRREDRAEFQSRDYKAKKATLRNKIREKISKIRSRWKNFSPTDHPTKYYPYFKKLNKYIFTSLFSAFRGKEFGLSKKSPSLRIAEAEVYYAIEEQWLLQQGWAPTRGKAFQTKIDKSLKEIRRLRANLLKQKKRAIQKKIKF